MSHSISDEDIVPRSITRAWIREILHDPEDEIQDVGIVDRVSRSSTPQQHSQGVPIQLQIYDDDSVQNLSSLRQRLVHLACQELEKLDPTPEFDTGQLSPATDASDILIWWDVDDGQGPTDLGPISIEPSGLGMDTDVLTRISQGLQSSPSKSIDVMEAIREKGDTHDQQTNGSRGPETFQEMLFVLEQWNSQVLGEQQAQDTSHLREGVWENTVISMLERSRLEAPEHYEVEKAKLKDRITAAMRSGNREEAKQLDRQKRKLNYQRYRVSRIKVLKLIREESKKDEYRMLQELRELRALHATVQSIVEGTGGPVAELLETCIESGSKLQHALGKLYEVTEEGAFVSPVMVDAMAVVAGEVLQKVVDLSKMEMEDAGLQTQRDDLQAARVMGEVRTGNQMIKELASKVHQQMCILEELLRETGEGLVQQYEACSKTELAMGQEEEEEEGEEEEPLH